MSHDAVELPAVLSRIARIVRKIEDGEYPHEFRNVTDTSAELWQRGDWDEEPLHKCVDEECMCYCWVQSSHVATFALGQGVRGTYVSDIEWHSRFMSRRNQDGMLPSLLYFLEHGLDVWHGVEWVDFDTRPYDYENESLCRVVLKLAKPRSVDDAHQDATDEEYLITMYEVWPLYYDPARHAISHRPDIG